MNTNGIELSVLDTGVLQHSVRLAPRVEALGYARYWISEHHGEQAIPNPTLLVPVIAGVTSTMRVGTAAILLAFQSALAVAENFRALARLFPTRIDLGLGRSITGAAHMAALLDGRPATYSPEDHAAKVADVQSLVSGRLPDGHPLQGTSLDPALTTAGPPALWVHSTSTEGAKLAARLGAHYSFHDHYKPLLGPRAVREYVAAFQPSPELAAPDWSVCVAGYCGEDEAEAREVGRAEFHAVPPGRHTIIGTVDVWRAQLAALADAYRTRHIVVQSLARRYDFDRQVASYTRIAEAARSLS